MMTSTTTKWSSQCAVCLVALGLTAVTDAKPIDLSPKFVEGETVQYVSLSTIKHHVQVELVDIDESILVRTESGMSLTAMDVDSNGVATLSWVLHYFAIETDGEIPGISEMLDYDSRRANSTNSPFAPMFDSIVEKPATVRVDAAGKVIDIQGLQPSGGAGPLDALARGFFSREAFEQLPFFVTAGAPSPAKVRSKWSRMLTVQMPLGVGSLEMVQDFAFPRIKPRQSTATILMTGVIRKSGTAGSQNTAMPAGVLSVEKGEMKGTFTWDFASGSLESAETTMTLSTSLTSVMGPMKLKQKMSSAIRRQAPSKPKRGPSETPRPRSRRSSRGE